MQTFDVRRHPWRLTILAGVALFGLAEPAVAQPLPPELAAEKTEWKDKDFKFQKAGACNDCHAQPKDKEGPELNIVLMTEYSIWKTHDKHAQAYAVLEGPRGRRMGELLGQNVLKKETGCLNCHAMDNLAGNADEGGLDQKDGVSCGGCHGPSSSWLAVHKFPAWRKKSAEEKFKSGLRDLRDPATRSALCLSCHVGNVAEGKVVTHDMFCAGHPPLPPIEIASFSRNEPQHWRDVDSVPFFRDLDKLPELDRQARVKNYHLEDLDFHRTKFALIGAIVSLRETMRLAQQRSDFKTPEPKVAWPELLTGLKEIPADDALRQAARDRWPEIALAHSDCYACHHDLQTPGYRQKRGFGYQLPLADLPPIRLAPGRVLIRTWPTAPLISTLDFLGQPVQRATLHGHLKGLAAVVNARPYGDPGEVYARTTEVIQWCDAILADLKKAKYDAAAVRRLLVSLCELYAGKDSAGRPMVPDYEMARLIASVLAVAYEEWSVSAKVKGTEKDKAANVVLDALTKQLNLEPYTRRQARLEVLFGIVAQGKPLNGRDEFKRYLANKTSIGSLDELKKLVDNPFVDAVRKMNNDTFNKGLLEDKNIKELQKLGDEEEDAVLKSISAYDPNEFKNQLKKLAETLK